MRADVEAIECERLIEQHGAVERYVPADIRFLDYDFHVPDVPSFLDQFKELFVEKIQDFMPNTRQPLIYDCGANIGMSCWRFKRLFSDARIIAYEADPTLAAVLTSNMRDNRIAGVEIRCQAAWTEDTRLPFTSEGADGGSLHVYGSWPRIMVDCVRFRSVLASTRRRVDLLKLDIEGAEVSVIVDCADVLDRVDRIFVEYHSWARAVQRLDLLLSVLSTNGFRYFIQTACERRSPFINLKPSDEVIFNAGPGEWMDLQLNICAYRG